RKKRERGKSGRPSKTGRTGFSGRVGESLYSVSLFLYARLCVACTLKSAPDTSTAFFRRFLIEVNIFSIFFPKNNFDDDRNISSTMCASDCVADGKEEYLPFLTDVGELSAEKSEHLRAPVRHRTTPMSANQTHTDERVPCLAAKASPEHATRLPLNSASFLQGALSTTCTRAKRLFFSSLTRILMVYQPVRELGQKQ
ncbi:hypothetical protein ALC62_01326, partial [Cyphomyrmex costatus]